jgi:hypothetical protein
VDLAPSSGDVGHCLMVIRCPGRLMADVIKSVKHSCPGFKHVHNFLMSLSSVTEATMVRSVKRLVMAVVRGDNA